MKNANLVSRRKSGEENKLSGGMNGFTAVLDEN